MACSKEERRLVLVGRTGVGKSSSGCTLIGSKVFKSSLSPCSVTVECEKAFVNLNDGSRLAVLDTPGLFDTSTDNNIVIKEISRSITLMAPGPHIFLFVVRIGRFTPEDDAAASSFFKHFGDAAANHTVILFTGADNLDEGDTIHSYLKSAPPTLNNLLNKCRNRYFAINNKARSESQVNELIHLINRVITENNDGHYSNEMYDQHVKMMIKNEEETRRQQEELERKRIKEIEDRKAEEVRKQMKEEQARQERLRREADAEAARLRRMREEEERQRRIAAENQRQAELLRQQQEEQRRRNEEQIRKAKEERERREAEEKRRLAQQQEAQRQELERQRREAEERARRKRRKNNCVLQ